ncbi:MAG: hypothetical protein KAJ07_08290 [Planctomycetes bacterium]|nr:hypothetical protein [Planctomycetota bacterium]
MAENGKEKPLGPTKSFMTIGPTLHYSHANVRRWWMLAVVVYIAVCFFWSKILTGSAMMLDLATAFSPESWKLGQFISSPLSIFEYPSQIIVFGLLMGIIAAAPLLISQLLSFRYSILMLLSVVFIAKLPLLGALLLLSCLAVACRPLRFRSRFIAIALCMAPQLVYWALFGGIESADPVHWGFSYAPWIGAWLTGLAISGIVIGIGHFTRYRPGLVWSVTTVFLLTAVVLFQTTVSFAELDYQLYIAGNNPDQVPEFYNHKLSKQLDETIADRGTKSFLAGLFYPTEPLLLREELKDEIQIQLGYDRWPNWFKVSEDLNFQLKRQWLLNQYDLFINKRSTSKRMPVALYYKAMLNEYTPDVRMFAMTETLHFYSDYPRRENLPIWYKLYDEFPQSPEALEARWRIAMHLAGQGEFEKATELCEVAIVMIGKQIAAANRTDDETQSLFAVFVQPRDTVMTTPTLKELQRKLHELKTLIGPENRQQSSTSKKLLAEFVILNPYIWDYPGRLDKLLEGVKKTDPLYDNIMLAKAMLLVDMEIRNKLLKDLSENFSKTDGGIQALYELGLVNVKLWKDHPQDGPEKQKYLANTRQILKTFIESHPKSIFTEHAQFMLNSLPTIE